MLQDLGVHDQVMAPAMHGLKKYDEAKADIMNVHTKGQDHYSRLAAAVQ